MKIRRNFVGNAGCGEQPGRGLGLRARYSHRPMGPLGGRPPGFRGEERRKFALRIFSRPPSPECADYQMRVWMILVSVQDKSISVRVWGHSWISRREWGRDLVCPGAPVPYRASRGASMSKAAPRKRRALAVSGFRWSLWVAAFALTAHGIRRMSGAGVGVTADSIAQV